MSFSTSTKRSSAIYLIALTFLLSTGYAILRYNIMGTVPWKDLPFFILNKSIALSAFILLSLSLSFKPLQNLGVRMPEKWHESSQSIGITAFYLAIAHTLMSLMIFKPSIFGKFFETDGTLTLFAGLSMLGGVLLFVFLWAYNLSIITHLRDNEAFVKFVRSRVILIFALSLAIVHMFFMGINGWLSPSDWNGGLPPISLIGFVFISISFLINLLGRN